jgi:hypothetical protein
MDDGPRKYDNSGNQTVKACGKAHAWCKVCRPDTAQRQRKPKPPNRNLPPCRNCGRCDYCLGLAVQEGMKTCRQCGETKSLAAFARRNDTGGYRNQCRRCKNGGAESLACEGCGRRFTRHDGEKVLCVTCRVPPTRPCEFCGTHFSGSVTRRRYCSPDCRDAAGKERHHRASRDLRQQLIEAYGGRCACPRCPETNPAFLTLEHVNGTGKAHREVVGSHAYADLRRRGWPKDGFTLLCFNCNLATRFGRTCPHMEQALAIAG